MTKFQSQTDIARDSHLLHCHRRVLAPLNMNCSAVFAGEGCGKKCKQMYYSGRKRRKLGGQRNMWGILESWGNCCRYQACINDLPSCLSSPGSRLGLFVPKRLHQSTHCFKLCANRESKFGSNGAQDVSEIHHTDNIAHSSNSHSSG